MVGKAGLKAGLIGVAVMVVWTLIGQFLLSGSIGSSLVSLGVSVILYAGIGVLAGFFLATPRSASNGAKAGLIAGLISWFVATVVGGTILGIRVASGAPIPGADPEAMQQLAEAGTNVGVMMAIGGAVGFLCSLVIGAGLATAGGAVFSTIVPD